MRQINQELKPSGAADGLSMITRKGNQEAFLKLWKIIILTMKLPPGALGAKPQCNEGFQNLSIQFTQALQAAYVHLHTAQQNNESIGIN